MYATYSTELTIIYIASQTASRTSTARKALYFARRRTDRSLTTLPSMTATVDVWNALRDHRSSVHSSAADGAVVAQLQFYADIVNLVASTSRRGSSVVEELRSSVPQLVDVYDSLVDCVGYLGAERAACTAFLPPHAAVCGRVGSREMFAYVQAAFAAEICFRSLGRRTSSAAKSNVLLAVRLYSDDVDGLAACRRRLLSDLGAPRRLQSLSAADSWKCGRARRLEQLRRLRLSLNGSTSDTAETVLREMERDIVATWTNEKHSAVVRLTVAVASLSTTVTYLLVGAACQCRTSPRRRRSVPSGDTAGANNELCDADNDSYDLDGRPLFFASSLTKSTSV